MSGARGRLAAMPSIVGRRCAGVPDESGASRERAEYRVFLCAGGGGGALGLAVTMGDLAALRMMEDSSAAKTEVGALGLCR